MIEINIMVPLFTVHEHAPYHKIVTIPSLRSKKSLNLQDSK